MYRYQSSFRDNPSASLGCAVLIVSLLGCSGLAYGLWPYTSTGTVVDTRWDQFIHRERFEVVTAEGWWNDLYTAPIIFPRDGQGASAGCENIRACESRYHHTDSYPCGQTCSGSGSNRHCSTRYCTTAVYRDWCKYDTGRWRILATTRTFGLGKHDMPWPEPPVLMDKDLERHTYEGQYLVSIDYDDSGTPGRHVETYHNDDDYKAWTDGDAVLVHLRAMTGVSYVEHVNLER